MTPSNNSNIPDPWVIEEETKRKKQPPEQRPQLPLPEYPKEKPLDT